MLTVYGRKSSSNVQLVMWALNELGIEHKRLDYGHGYASTHSEEFLKKNPMGTVPVLEHDSIVVFESAAILRYLGATYGDDIFWPKDPALRVSLDTWAEWGKNTFSQAVLEIFAYDVRLSPETRDPEILKIATEKVAALARIFESRIESRSWICGEDFTFADIACGHILYRYFSLDWQRPSMPALFEYYERLKSRPAYRDHVMVSYEELRGSY